MPGCGRPVRVIPAETVLFRQRERVAKPSRVEQDQRADEHKEAFDRLGRGWRRPAPPTDENVADLICREVKQPDRDDAVEMPLRKRRAASTSSSQLCSNHFMRTDVST
jgi:hypothetical protein